MKRLALGLILTLTACSDGSRPSRPGSDSGLPPDSGDTMDTGAPPADSGGTHSMMSMVDTGPPPHPFHPANGCGAAAIETQQLPGSVLLAFDQSASMQADTDGERPAVGPSKWDLATGAITTVLGSLPDELSVGLLLFPDPDGGDCSVEPSPQVEVAPLSETRAAINSALSRTPDGGNTPAIAAVEAAWAYMLPQPFPGQRGVILVTDGAENCDVDDGDVANFHNQARTNNLAFGVTSYAVGLTTTNNLLSGLAFNGGTPRTPACQAMCTTEGERCTSSAECTGGTCSNLPIIGRVCVGGTSSECCHYDISEGAFRAEFEMALREIAESFLDSCVFDLPRGDDPSRFDPALVNVGVTFEGEERRVLSKSDDPAVDSWNYTSPSNESIIIQGPLCEELLEGDATVEIVLGCPTILI